MEKLYQTIEPERPKTEKSKAEEDEQVRVAIEFARQMCAQMGNNDQEFDILNDIWNRYEEGYLTAKEAIKEARAIPESKMQR